MRQASIAMLAALFLAVVAVPAVPAIAQTTKPSADLAKENADLRAYAEKLEARVAELEAKLKEEQKKLSPRVEIRPLVPAPYGYQLPAQPFRIPNPAPGPKSPDNTLRIAPLPKESTPENWRRHEFNGQEFYLIPLR
jgi:hypothetical protein